jgi:arylsulfatase A-like enzyme
MRAVLTAALLAALSWACRTLDAPRVDADRQPPRRPNIVFIVADDLGWGDVGAFGQKKIRTPNLDRMAAEGMRFTQHYAGNAVCAPSRCVLMTGKHPGHAYIRDNRERKPEGQEPIPADTLTLAKLLARAGYATGGFGKWGLGGPGTSGEPLKQGLQRFFGYNCQRVAHNYYPTYLWDDDRRLPLDNPDLTLPQVLPPEADEDDPASYRQYTGRQYAPDLIMERARGFIRDNKDRPFFCYVPTTVPHLALQVPADSLAEYLGQWPDPHYEGGRGYTPHFAPRAAYAAMVTRMDREVGRIMDLVAELGLDERTLFVFTSDNGPPQPPLAGTDAAFFASAGPFRGFKGSLHEGGVRVPAIARWKGRIAQGTVSDRVTGFEDWLPTLLELIDAREASPRDLDGISFARTLLGGSQEPRPFLYREFPGYGGQQSIRVGDWKAIRKDLKPRDATAPPRMQIELYDLATDVAETRDLASEHPEMVARLEKLMLAQHVPSKEFPLPALDRLQAEAASTSRNTARGRTSP